MNTNQDQSTGCGSQINSEDERDELYRIMGVRHTALLLALEKSVKNCDGSDAATIVKEAEVFFEFLK